MNSISPNHILVDHPIKDKDGKTYTGFYGIFKTSEEPSKSELDLLEENSKMGRVTYYGSIKETVDLLNEFIR